MNMETYLDFLHIKHLQKLQFKFLFEHKKHTQHGKIMLSYASKHKHKTNMCISTQQTLYSTY